MQKKYILIKFAILMILFVCFATFTMVGYAYWDKTSNGQIENVPVGDWGVAISTAQEFYDFATKTNSSETDRYYLFNDIDFTGFTWTLDAANNNVTFRGTLDGNGKTLSNLTIYTNSNTYQYLGIFPRMEGGSVYNLTLNNVILSLGSTALSGSSYTSGLISGEAYGLTNIINDITIINSGVRGTSSTGTGGLIGSISNATTIVNIDDIKATGLRVFSTNSNVGGIVGNITTNGSQVNISDIDIQGEVYSNGTSSYTGGIIGNISIGATLNLNRAIVEMTSRNTLETNSTYYLQYSDSYLGGIIGYNQSSSLSVVINDVFFTGEIVTRKKNQERNVGTLIGASNGSETVSNAYYSQVLFGYDGSTNYVPSKTPRGVMSTLVNSSTMPSISWWNTFSNPFSNANSLWAQNLTTGRLYLVR